ncbi:histidinol-phosphatase [Oceanibaculum pacificum]|uniref:Histidinol-phosphatase n=1 Tax=Oceanibaculum pacificum TaxID=580166 RepID=A0A154W3Y9_9PROT|nr:histidinol-phosphatase [Oceanibaculum pacificum]KZD08260.1 histidinol phosphate phosphatase [Oceanibaculum pacificum]
MSETCPAELIRFAGLLADEAGTVAQRYFRSGVLAEDKADESPVTIADRTAEAVMRERIEKEFPEHGIIGEEHGTVRRDADWVWVLDPIDGTKAFITGKPLFGTLIGLLHKNRPILGVINQPIIHDRWIGAAGHPTTLNDIPARTRRVDGGLAQAILQTTSPDMFKGDKYGQFNRVVGATKFTHWGGDCYGFGLLAAGFIDLAIESSLQLYDWVALAPVIENAGGIITDWQGRPLEVREGSFDVIACGDRALLDPVVALLNG